MALAKKLLVCLVADFADKCCKNRTRSEESRWIVRRPLGGYKTVIVSNGHGGKAYIGALKLRASTAFNSQSPMSVSDFLMLKQIDENLGDVRLLAPSRSYMDS